MKKTCLNLVLLTTCLLILTSCSRKFNFVTKGLPNTDSSYLVTTDGKRIEASAIEIKTNNKLMVDGQAHSLDDLSAIKSKKMYFGVKDNKVYAGESYGKICVLYELVYGSSYQPNTRMASGGYAGNGTPGSYVSSTTKVEYLQKLGSSEIDQLNLGTLIDYVSDNDQALAVANSAKPWKTINTVSFYGFLGSVAYGTVVAIHNGKTAPIDGVQPAQTSYTVPLLAAGATLVIDLISGSIENHKIRKAIKIYNSTPNTTAQ